MAGISDRWGEERNDSKNDNNDTRIAVLIMSEHAHVKYVRRQRHKKILILKHNAQVNHPNSHVGLINHPNCHVGLINHPNCHVGLIITGTGGNGRL